MKILVFGKYMLEKHTVKGGLLMIASENMKMFKLIFLDMYFSKLSSVSVTFITEKSKII